MPTPLFKRYVIVMVVLATVICLLPFAGAGTLFRTYVSLSSGAPIAIVGSSTLVQVSPCDKDRRNVTGLLSDLTQRRVTDLSVGGQPLIDSINLAAIAGLDAGTKDVVFPIPHPYLDDWTTPPFRKLSFFKLMLPGFPVFRAETLPAFLDGFTGRTILAEQPYTFDGRSHAAYNVLAAQTFSYEKEHETCPETVTHDWDFTRSYYWWTHVAKRDNPDLAPLIGDLARSMRARGRRLHVAVLATNLDLLGKLDPAWPAIVASQQARLVSELSHHRVDVIDLSDKFEEDEFSTQWCGCVHLNEAGACIWPRLWRPASYRRTDERTFMLRCTISAIIVYASGP